MFLKGEFFRGVAATPRARHREKKPPEVFSGGICGQSHKFD
jgi:hypothetical protein